MLKYAKNGLLNFKDFNILNIQIATYLSNSNFTNTIIVAQKN